VAARTPRPARATGTPARRPPAAALRASGAAWGESEGRRSWGQPARLGHRPQVVNLLGRWHRGSTPTFPPAWSHVRTRQTLGPPGGRGRRLLNLPAVPGKERGST